MPGDVIQTEFGIKVYGIWVTDIQGRFAYVFKGRRRKKLQKISKAIGM